MIGPVNQILNRKIMTRILIFACLFIHSLANAQVKKAKLDTGIASFYADKFHGRKTASGEIFHQDSLTAAHKSLPFGTLVKVTNLRNNQSVIVKVNDRGMKGTNRVIDLSKAAARELNMLGPGLVKVKVEVLTD
jgi:rare lipoprotein A